MAGGLTSKKDNRPARSEGEGVLVHFDGQAFTRHRAPDGTLLSVAAVGPGEAWAVGRLGGVLHVEAGRAEAFHLEAPVVLRGVAATGPNDVWMVGDGSTLPPLGREVPPAGGRRRGGQGRRADGGGRTGREAGLGGGAERGVGGGAGEVRLALGVKQLAGACATRCNEQAQRTRTATVRERRLQVRTRARGSATTPRRRSHRAAEPVRACVRAPNPVRHLGPPLPDGRGAGALFRATSALPF